MIMITELTSHSRVLKSDLVVIRGLHVRSKDTGSVLVQIRRIPILDGQELAHVAITCVLTLRTIMATARCVSDN